MDFNTDESSDYSGFASEASSIFVTNLALDAINNNLFFATKWTSRNIQFALMSVLVRSETGLDMHQNSDRFFYVTQGSGLVTMGNWQECLNFQALVHTGFGIFIPAGAWYNVVNVGQVDLKMVTVYAPTFHSYNTTYTTKEEWLSHHEP
ncbi:cupin domain-containing protein [Kineothrix sp. MB12-C1]|uniref:cupin domain-containing protein n=1 Tax=Kineothrix sp. MB12-C1 TaxID=3070215 RepID=UPI0027D2A41C|nr:cupin domain-containing protein [Kineothrix sp. MB12-C1]WMC93757.1 cupin domain-containing protein [Kineothrix sp. MB12-C1]